jgi:AraC-like DNA-binding protein
MYFDDLEFLAADEDPACRAVIDQRFTGMHNLQFVAAGCIRFGVDDRPDRLLRAPAVFWHDPAHRYRYRPAEAESWHHMWVTFRGARARRLLAEGFGPLSEDHGLELPAGEGVEQSMRVLIGAVRDAQPLSHARCVAILEQLLVEVIEVAGGGWGDLREAALAALGQAIRSGPFAQWDWDEQARRLHLSPGHFRRLFRRRLGASPHQFLLDARMRRSAALLASTDLQVKQIAGRCGYEPAQFSKLFRKRMGLWPTEFRHRLPVGEGPGQSRASPCPAS